MNYIAEINAFYDWLLYNSLPTGAIALWHALISINNKAGWADEFTVANLVLQGMTGLSRQGLDKARNILIQKDLIRYKKGTSNQAGKYKMVSLVCKKVGTVVGTEEGTENPECKKVGTAGAQQLTQQGRSSRHSSRHSSSTLNKQNETKQNEDDDVVIKDNDPFVYYSKNIGPMLPDVADLIKQYQKDLPDELITEAFKISVKNNARTFRYAEKIMISWLDKGIRTIADYKRHEAEWESQKTKSEASKSEPQERKYSQEEIEAAAKYIKKQVERYTGDDVLEYIRALGYPDEIQEGAINLLTERKELIV